jgi:F420-non-reducing hydrogenase iron-sulfur subunit
MTEMNLSKPHPGFEPRVLAFTCNWGAYGAADLAGAARIQYPANLRIIRVMCSVMVHPDLVVKAFGYGADAVLLMGCPPGECHYRDGNRKAKARSARIEEALSLMGIELERFKLIWCSSAEVERFACLVREIDEMLRGMGPLTRGKDGVRNRLRCFNQGA